MPSIYGAMNTAVTALMTHQLALEVTGQNISNVNNPDYTKQTANLGAAYPIQMANGAGMIGTGVRVTSITRQYDQYVESQRVTAKANTGFWDAKSNVLGNVETLFNESSESGLNNQLDEFFASWQDLAANPSGMTERTSIITQGQNLTSMFNKVSQDIKTVRSDLDTKVTGSLSEINSLSTQIAEYNRQIHQAEVNNVNANDFRDKRDALVRELSGYTEVKAVEDSKNNQITVSMKNGRPLVIGQTAFQLSSRVRADDTGTSDIYWKDADGTYTKVTDEMTTGSVGAWIEMRDTEIDGYLDKIDRLAATMVRDINNLHSSGYGQDNGTGRNFFGALSPTVNPGTNNTGTGVISSSGIADQYNVNLDKFEITFTGPNTFDVRNSTQGTVVASNQAYTPGADMSYFLTQGIHVSINGAISTGDTFEVNAAKNASSRMSIDSTVSNDILKIAAGKTTISGDGDNALDIARLQNNMTMNKMSPDAASGTATFAEYYNSLVGEVGVSSKAATTIYNQQETINTDLENRHEQVSGVSLDQEMVDLIKFQHAYQAAARMINVVDTLLQTLIGMGA